MTEHLPDPAVPSPPATGDAGVDAATAQVVAALDGTVEDRLLAFEAAHRALQDRLADVEG